jgi:hypothetical protein
MNCRTDDSTRNQTGRGFVHKWPKPRHNLYRFSSEKQYYCCWCIVVLMLTQYN